MIDTASSGLPKEGDLLDGKYLVGPVLGVGGMAAVIAAKHQGLDEMVAIKMLLPDCCDEPAVVERFAQEGKTAIKIKSEHVVRMLDVGTVAGRPYLVMEYLRGKDLEAVVRAEGPLPVAVAVDMVLQATEAIGEAHALGIVHRDLKPANLFLTHRADGSPCVKVLDFGISKMPRKAPGETDAGTSARPTLASTVMGSPQYMAPEQMLSAKAADQRSDIWSLGAVLYELLSGKLAFNGTTTNEICLQVLQGQSEPLADVRPDVPADVARIVERCLAKEPADRFANVAELALALAPFGTSVGQAAAVSIARVVGPAHEAHTPAPSAVTTLKPTAAEILATAPPRKRGRTGLVAGAIVAMGALGVVAGNYLHQLAPFALGSSTVAAVVAPLPAPEVAPATVPVIAPPSPPAPKPTTPARAHHVAAAVHPTVSGEKALEQAEETADEKAAATNEDAGPYDSP